ncbi:hypothetical protein TNCV_1612961 [Trichonephila clavipes]|nr:hypothetical protein TNCV_1612961 [Trichonephila clavipes]
MSHRRYGINSGPNKRPQLFSCHNSNTVGKELTSLHWLYLQFDDHVHPGIARSSFKVKKTRPSSYGVLPSPAELDMNEQMSYFSSFSDEWSRDMKKCSSTETAFMSRSKKIDLIQLARDLDESPDPSMSKIVLRNLIISSKYYKEEEAKELLEVITAERLETEQQQN